MATRVMTKIKKAVGSQVKTKALPAVGVAIEYPQEGEQVMPGHYAVRIGAPAGAEVAFSADGKTWGGCRFSVGHYWFDWNPSSAGKAKLAARFRVGNGRWTKTAVRSVNVAGSSWN